MLNTLNLIDEYTMINSYGYLRPNSYYSLTEKVISEADAIKLNLIPLSLPCIKEEYWILHNMALDSKRLNLNYCFVKEDGGVAIWKAKHTKQNKHYDTKPTSL